MKTFWEVQSLCHLYSLCREYIDYARGKYLDNFITRKVDYREYGKAVHGVWRSVALGPLQPTIRVTRWLL